MRQLLTFLLGIVLLVSPAGAAQKTVPEIVRESVVRLTIHDMVTERVLGVCTAWALGNHQFQTAAHCVPEAVMDSNHQRHQTVIRVANIVARKVKVDYEMDLALLLVDLDKPALTLRQNGPELFELVQALGYAEGRTSPTLTSHTVLMTAFLNESIPMIMYYGAFIGGMSGGPVFDERGLVVGIVQQRSDPPDGPPMRGFGVGVEIIRAFLNGG